MILIIVFVFDPLAISLVIADNFLFDRLRKKETVIEREIETEPELEVKNKKKKLIYKKRDAQDA